MYCERVSCQVGQKIYMYSMNTNIWLCLQWKNCFQVYRAIFKMHCNFTLIIAHHHFLFIERLLAAQNPLAQADRPHQLFADAPPAPVAATTLAPPAAVMPPAVMAVPVPSSIPSAPNMPPSGPPMPPVPPGLPPPGKLSFTYVWKVHAHCVSLTRTTEKQN